MADLNNGIFYSFLERSGFNGSEPYFYNTADFPWVKHLEDNWMVIRDELDALIKSGQPMEAYFDKDLVTVAQSWKTIAFFAWGVKFFKACSKAPKTTALLESVPGMLSASFNMLEGNSTIKPHNGDTNAIVRCHLGLYVPAGLPETGFRVGTEKQPWNEGKFFIFCDAHEHTAWNNSGKKRYILLMDVMLPKFKAQQNDVRNTVLASLFLQSAAQKLSFLHKMPFAAQMLMLKVAKIGSAIAVPAWNFFGKLFIGEKKA
jgi:aspartyl/asparaginyl beta-hydroxylase (cupin superfamily)